MPASNHVTDEAWLAKLSRHIRCTARDMARSYRLSREDREDLEQELSIKAISISQEHRQPVYWAYSKQAIRNHAIDKLRKHLIVATRYPGLDEEDERHASTASLDQVDSRLSVAQLCSLLPGNQAMLVHLHTGLAAPPITDHRKLSNLTGIPVAGIPGELESALTAMRQALTGDKSIPFTQSPVEQENEEDAA